MIYIREAHAIDSAMPMDFGLVEDPVHDAERASLARTCVARLELPIPTLVDGVDDAVGKAYGAWPDRLYLVGKDGRVAYAGARGPRGFAPDEWEAAIVAELARAAAEQKDEAGKRETGDKKAP